MAQGKDICIPIFGKLEGKVKETYQAGKYTEEDIRALCEILSANVRHIDDGLPSQSPPDPTNVKKQSSVTNHNNGPVPRQSSLQEHTAQSSKKLNDASQMQVVKLFYQNGLFNLLQGVPDDVDDHVLKHVQKVTMAMHKQAYDKLWGLVRSELESSEAVRSILLNKFLPTIQPQPTNSTDYMGAFQEWFEIVHCSGKEPHPPTDVRPSLDTMDAVMKIKEDALEKQNLDCTELHGVLISTIEADCVKRLEENSMLIMHAKKSLSLLAHRICKVVSAMLIHSSPIIPFTRLEAFFPTYHEPTRDARQDPEGRRVLVYRTPYLYYYHYGELKTLHKASVTFEEPPKTLSTSLPVFMEDDLYYKVKWLFVRDTCIVDCLEANRKTDSFVEWYHFANETLTKAMQKKSLLTSQEHQLLTPRYVNPDCPCLPEFLKAFNKRHRLLAEQSSILTSSGLEKKLTERIRASRVLPDQKDVDLAVQLVIAFLCSPDLWIPYGIKYVPNFMPSFHTEVTADYEPHRANVYQAGHVTCGQPPHTKRQPQFPIKCYLRPLLVKFATGKYNEPLFPPRVILK